MVTILTMRRAAITLALILFLLPFVAHAELAFPALTGRVVDQAGIISPAAQEMLTQELAAHENATTNQVVVVTLSSLQGTTIENYGYQLGRSWGIGQKGKDNGILLIVAPSDRKVRIEVGYGLEGTMTDALASDIIQNTILPDFRSGQMERGVIEGTDAILKVLNGNYQQNAGGSSNFQGTLRHIQGQAQHIHLKDKIFMTLFIILLIGKIVAFCDPQYKNQPLFKRHRLLQFWLIMSSGSGSGHSGGGFGGGFSGGGGGFGGGGASGGW